MLHRLPREFLSRCIFPLGEAENKQAVRTYAEQSAIPAAQKKDSMDLCFIPDGDWCGWLERNGVQLPEGNFVDESGNILGRHRGLHRYTVGQRKGLGISAAGRLFVTGLRPEPNEIVLSLTDPRCYELTAEQMHYCAPEYAANGPFPCSVRVRFSQRADPAVVHPAGIPCVLRSRMACALLPPGRLPCCMTAISSSAADSSARPAPETQSVNCEYRIQNSKNITITGDILSCI